MSEVVSLNIAHQAKLNSLGCFEPTIAVDLTISEIVYRADHTNQVLQQRHFRTTHFDASPDELRKIARLLNESAQRAETDFHATMEATLQNR